MKFDIYDGDEKVRFSLGQDGSRKLFVVGLNPSTADESKPDPTINKVEKLIKVWRFNGFVMLNLYPFRASRPKDLPRLHDAALAKRNTETIREELQRSKTGSVWAAWGNAFDIRGYFKNCLTEILSKTQDLNLEWKKCESFTKSQNPRHPLSGRPHIITEQSILTDFDVEDYLSQK